MACHVSATSFCGFRNSKPKVTHWFALDHGPLAVAEILLAGCPIIGVERGCPFVLAARTGIRLDHFTPISVLEGIEKCVVMDRNVVRQIALRMFDAERIAAAVIEALDYARQFDPAEVARNGVPPPSGYPVESFLG
jgi:hypothetical protein